MFCLLSCCSLLCGYISRRPRSASKDSSTFICFQHVAQPTNDLSTSSSKSPIICKMPGIGIEFSKKRSLGKTLFHGLGPAPTATSSSNSSAAGSDHDGRSALIEKARKAERPISVPMSVVNAADDRHMATTPSTFPVRTSQQNTKAAHLSARAVCARPRQTGGQS